MDIAEIERRVDRAIAAPIPVDMTIGGVALENMGQVMEFAKLMAVSGSAVPKYLRGNPGGCLAICSRALRWGMDPFAVAEKSYQVINKGEERIAYEATLVHAVITSRAPLKTRLRHVIEGEGDDRVCTVWGTFKGEDTPHKYTSPTLKQLRDARGRNEYGNIKGSPLWDTVPEVQIAYSTYRQWCRLYASEVILGVYTPDEIADNPRDVTPKVSELAQRLRDAKAADGHRGFSADHVRDVSLNSIIEGNAKPGNAKQEDVEDAARNEPDTERRKDDTESRGSDDRDQGGSEGIQRAGREDGGEPAGEESPGAQASEAGAPDTEQAKDKASRK